MTAWHRRRAGRFAGRAALLASVLALIWGAIWLQLAQERIATERDVRQETGNLTLAFEENIIRSIAAIDQVILIVRDAYARDPAQFNLRGWARDRAFINDQTFQIALVDSSGMLLQSNLEQAAERVDVSDREHFRVQADASRDALFISRPVLGRVSNRYSVQFTRRIIGPDGEFLGVVVASLDPFYLGRFYESLRIGHGFVMLVGLDGYVRASRPAIEHMDLPLAASPLLELAERDAQGSYRIDAGEVTGQASFVSYRRLTEYPLIVAVGFGVDEVFAAYRLHRFQYVVAGIGMTALVLCIGVLLDSHRRRLAKYQEELTATLENMSQGIVMVDPDRRVAVINRRVGELLGLPPRLLQENTTLDDILRWQVEHGEFASPGAGPDSVQDLVARGGLDASVPVYERTRPNGIVLEIRTALLPNGGAVRTYTDITGRKRNEQDLAAARDAAESGARARSQFLAVMSHEIRTPLNGIIGAAGLLMDRRFDAEEFHYVQIIRQSGDHLLQLVNDILDFSRLDASCVELDEVPFDVRATIAGAVDMLTTAAQQKGLDLALTIADDVPPRVVGDPGRLRQILLNLTGNAVKFTERGAVRIDVSAAGDAPHRVRLTVAIGDTGIGIPAEALPHLFDEFSQVDGSISRRFGGSGLGLAISRRLVERMGGSVSVQSVVGEGSTFRFDILLKEAPMEVSESGEEATVANPPLSRLRILLAEDNGTNRLVASRMIERMGHRVDAVADGTEAVQAVRSIPYDVVLMDLMMPEMDGLTATKLIRAEPGPVGRTPIIGLTANAEQGREAACRDAGMNAFVSKPAPFEQLAAAIQAVAAAGGQPVAAACARPLLDARVLGLLAEDIGQDGALDVVRLFLTEVPRMIDRLEQALVARGSALLREVHTLASASRSVGLLRLGHEAAEIEEALADGDAAADRSGSLPDLMQASVRRLAEWEAAQEEVASGVT
ncbi:MAG: ATP-binding protein [Acetobacteraceae bacterium]